MIRAGRIRKFIGTFVAPLAWHRGQPLPDAVYRELVATLFTMTVPILGLGCLFVAIGSLIFSRWPDPVIGVATGGAAIITIARLLLINAYNKAGGSEQNLEALREWERRYAIGAYGIAVLLAALNVRVLTIHSPLYHMTAVSLLFTFGAGIVSRIAGRPAICIVSLLLATVPTIIALGLHSLTDNERELHAQLFFVESVLVAMVTVMSIESARHLYRTAVEHLTVKHDLALLAKQDALTGLANRLLLRERFQESIKVVQLRERYLALHCLDLDGFKAVNDVHGHPAGDALLREVSRRLTATVRSCDTVARLGGDEFVIIQEGVRHMDEAEMLARRILKQLSAPYEIEGKLMRVSVSVGIAIAPEHGLDLERLAACADSALYRAKAKGKAQLHFCTPEDAVSAARAVA